MVKINSCNNRVASIELSGMDLEYIVEAMENTVRKDNMDYNSLKEDLTLIKNIVRHQHTRGPNSVKYY